MSTPSTPSPPTWPTYDWPARLAAIVAAAAAKKERKRALNAAKNTARTHGLRQRHHNKLNRNREDNPMTTTEIQITKTTARETIRDIRGHLRAMEAALAAGDYGKVRGEAMEVYTLNGQLAFATYPDEQP